MFSKKKVVLDKIAIGSDSPVSVQSMYEGSLFNADIPSLVNRIYKLNLLGLDIIRVSYTKESEKENLSLLSSLSPIDVVADIHFDYRLALSALDAGVSKIRINPGNIGAEYKTREVVKKAKDLGKAIRIGLNAGSLPKEVKGMGESEAMVESALKYIEIFESEGFENTVVSLKSSDAAQTIEAARKFSSLSSYPLHLGVTEAGGVIGSSVRSSWALSTLLSEKIGDTIRVSMSASMEEETEAGSEILKMLGLRAGVRIISCPGCGRSTFDTHEFLKRAKWDLLSLNKDISIAVMGCPVNGPGEAEKADYAVTGSGRSAYIYKKGKRLEKTDLDNAKRALIEVINEG